MGIGQGTIDLNGYKTTKFVAFLLPICRQNTARKSCSVFGTDLSGFVSNFARYLASICSQVMYAGFAIYLLAICRHHLIKQFLFTICTISADKTCSKCLALLVLTDFVIWRLRSLEIGCKMLRKIFLPVFTGWLSRKNKHIFEACQSTLSGSSHMDSKEAKYIDTGEFKKIDKRKLKTSETKKNKPTSGNKVNKETLNIVNYVQNINPDIISVCPKHIMRIIRSESNALYLIGRNSAMKFISMIIDDLSKNMCFVAELNPGFGVLTTELLKAGVPLIHLYEEQAKFYPLLDKLCAVYPKKLDLRHFNLIKISKLLYIDKQTDGKQIQEVLQGVEDKKWEDETCMQVIGTGHSESFFRHLIYSLLFRNCFMSCGRPVFYLAIPPSLWHKYTCDNNNYTTTKIMFQMMFEYKFLGTLNRKDFLPWSLAWKKNMQRYNSLNYQLDQDEIYVIKLEPKINIYSLLSQEDWILFWYFLRHNMRKRCNRLIPELEKWIPGCGVKLIAKDYTIFTQFGELTPVQLMNVFKEFKSWPEFKTCSFLNSMTTSLNTYDEPTLLEFEKMHDK